MSQSAEKYYTPEEYFALEEKSDRKSEYYNGKIYLMSGGSANHSRISGNTYFELRLGLRNSGCEVFNSDIRILAQESDFYTYPDVSVVCGGIVYVPGRNDTITNPVMVVEVLSPSTRNYDRGEKFEFYRTIESLQIYLVIDQYKVSIECFQKQEDGIWQFSTYNSPDQQIELVALGVTLAVSSLYEAVEFPSKPSKRPREKIIPHPSIED